ncbi:MAG: hypothetical protein HKN70_06340 [Gammaproteobacteria bacterium]|nr:hypothetical protein [Gammaproteobacteria bacterium]
MALTPAQSRFRERYRAQISPRYNPFRHLLWVFGTGLLLMGFISATLESVRLLELLVVPLTLIVTNFGEYATHRWLGHDHRRRGSMFYTRHFVEHHGFYSHKSMAIEQGRDLRLVLFPIWLIFAMSLGVIAPLSALLAWLWSTNAAALFAITALASYLLYEFMHLCFHLPADNRLTTLPGVAFMRLRHTVHHDPAHMGDCNFNLTWPMCDWALDTTAREIP